LIRFHKNLVNFNHVGFSQKYLGHILSIKSKNQKNIFFIFTSFFQKNNKKLLKKLNKKLIKKDIKSKK